MEAAVVGAGMLSRFIVLQSDYYSGDGYAHYNAAGFVLVGEDSVFSPLVKIEVEEATSNRSYINLRFCHSNKYWARRANGSWFIAAESSKPDEDTTKTSCTLFEAVKVEGSEEGLFHLTHVQSGGRLLLDPTTLIFYINENPNPGQGHLRFVNWDELVKLPKRVAFKGYNGRYLGEVSLDGHRYLQLSFDDPNAEACGHEVHLMPDGHVRVKSRFSDRVWRRIPNWIGVDAAVATAAGVDIDTLFWPVRVNDTTVALRNAGNNRYCKALTAQGKTDCLNADGSAAADTQAGLVVEELVVERRIHNVRYRTVDARILDEKPFEAGTAVAVNQGDTEAGVPVEVVYDDVKSHSFSRDEYLTEGVPETSIECALPFVQSTLASFETNMRMEWNKTTTTTTPVEVTGTVHVPARSKATVRYVGTMGTHEVPFSYTRQDRSSTDGRIIESEEIDGVFRGVNAYNFSFFVDKTEPL